MSNQSTNPPAQSPAWQPADTTNYLKDSNVQALTRAGFTLFALGGTPENDYKDPAAGGWQNTVYDPALVASRLPDIYGVLLTADILVVDFDPKRGATALQDLWDYLGIPRPVDTYIVATGSGGLHMYFRKPPECQVVARLTKKGYDAVELKTLGKFVVGAGSLHWATGNHYTVYRGSPDNIAVAPQALLDFCQKDPFELVQRDGYYDDSAGAQQSFIHYIMNVAPPAVEGMGGDATTLSVALVGRDYGLTQLTCLALMLDYYNPAKCRPEWSHEDMETKVRNAYTFAQGVAGAANAQADFADVPSPGKHHPKTAAAWEVKGWDQDKTGKLMSTMQNVANMFMLEQNPTAIHDKNELFELVKYNEFADAVEFTRAAPWHKTGRESRFWGDIDDCQLELFFSYCRHLNVSPQIITRGVEVIANMYAYDPVQDYLNGVTWDRVARLDKLFIDYMGADDTPINREIGKNTIMAAVARAFDPGCKHDSMVVMESKQGRGKTEFVKILGGYYVPGQNWFANIPLDPKSRDTTDKMLGSWFLEAAEMEFMSKVEVASFKSWMTITADKERLAYKRRSKLYPRRCIVLGSINPEKDDGYLTDETGNRRFWPIAVRDLKREELIRDRDQLFAEAVVRYKSGEPCYITDATLQERIKEVQESRMRGDFWLPIIQEWISGIGGQVPLTNQAIAEYALKKPYALMTPTDARRVGKVMRKLGYMLSKPKWVGSAQTSARVWELDPFQGLGLDV